MDQPIEKMSVQDLTKAWEQQVSALADMDKTNPKWEWRPVQLCLEHLHALARELNNKKALERAKWQP
jgi:hypothetical protein